MPVPTVLNNKKIYGLVWTGQLTVGPNVRNPQRGGGVVKKTFHAYVENYEQSAHDKAMAAYVQRIGGTPRSPHRAQVGPTNTKTAPLEYYESHGQVASELTAKEMQRFWTNQFKAKKNATVFKIGLALPLAVQKARQSNGFHYDVTMWYDVRDVYVAFHCYRP
ncbi:MAG: hypothetical protein KAR13_04925 [Desulfobulbaceae bacterium]|nr:hypothetical protein [Desulfobulbaceae bacterium]